VGASRPSVKRAVAEFRALDEETGGQAHEAICKTMEALFNTGEQPTRKQIEAELARGPHAYATYRLREIASSIGGIADSLQGGGPLQVARALGCAYATARG
jgi:hypothetical protein